MNAWISLIEFSFMYFVLCTISSSFNYCIFITRNFSICADSSIRSSLSTLPCGNIGCYAFDRAKCHILRCVFPDIIKLGCVFVLAHFAALLSPRAEWHQQQDRAALLHSFSARHHSPKRLLSFPFASSPLAPNVKILNHGHRHPTSGWLFSACRFGCKFFLKNASSPFVETEKAFAADFRTHT